MKLILYPQGQNNCSRRKYEFRRRLRKRKKKCVVGEKIEGGEGGEGEPLSALLAPSYFAPWKKKLFLVKDFVMRKIIDFGINKNYNYKK